MVGHGLPDIRDTDHYAIMCYICFVLLCHVVYLCNVMSWDDPLAHKRWDDPLAHKRTYHILQQSPTPLFTVLVTAWKGSLLGKL